LIFFYIAVIIVVDFSKMIPQEFEKDDDTNGHIDYIVATAVSSIIAA